MRGSSRVAIPEFLHCWPKAKQIVALRPDLMGDACDAYKLILYFLFRALFFLLLAGMRCSGQAPRFEDRAAATR
jgi:hypothetical protein